MISDARAAVDFLLARTPAKRVVLLGICSAGKVAIGEACDDPRVTGLALWSAEAMGYLRSSTAKAHKSLYAVTGYLQKLTHLDTWRKILTGRVNTQMVKKAVLVKEAPDEAETADESAMLDRFRAFKGSVLFIYGGNDPETTIAARKYSRFCTQHGIRNTFHEIAEANHSFYSLVWERQVVDLTLEWFAHASTDSLR
jgi:dienelactone hydrolase